MRPSELPHQHLRLVDFAEYRTRTDVAPRWRDTVIGNRLDCANAIAKQVDIVFVRRLHGGGHCNLLYLKGNGRRSRSPVLLASHAHSDKQ